MRLLPGTVAVAVGQYSKRTVPPVTAQRAQPLGQH